jgi:hypothetical protein
MHTSAFITYIIMLVETLFSLITLNKLEILSSFIQK